jgi:3D-(3,5/4)-trihydroxycyclohexane-1,2-dione acylhydrolase (decyclizing)
LSGESTISLTASQAIIRYLAAQYTGRDGTSRRLVRGFLGIFGHGNSGGFGQALDEARNQMFFIEGRNEQGMAHTAAAYAKALRREAVLACTTSIGPGSTNMLTAVAGAYINRLPMLVLPADTYANRRQGPILQGLEYPSAADVTVNDCFRPVTRFFDRITRPEQLLDSMPKAMRILTDPADCGPVAISVPQDVQVASYDFPLRFFNEKVWPIARPRADVDQIGAAAELIRAAKNPLIVAGGGVLYSRAEEALAEFVEYTRIPVAETLGGKGAGPAGSPLNLGGLGVAGTHVANELAKDADLVISIGSRLSDYVTGSNSVFQNPDVRFIGINVNSADAAKCGSLSVVGDARLTIQALTKPGTAPTTRTRSGQATGPDELHRSWAKAREEAFSPAATPPLRQTELVGLLNDWLRPGDTLVTSAGTLPGDVFRYWQGREGTECHIEFGNSCMGYDIAGAIGVGLAKESGEVFALLGDATFLLSPSDLAVAVQHRRKITVIVSDNQGMRSIRGLESRTVANPYANIFRYRDPFSYQLGDPLTFDIARIAEGFGTTPFCAETRQEFTAALAKAREVPAPCVIVVKTDVDRSPSIPGAWWDIAPASTSRDDSLDDLRRQYEQAREKQRYYL